MILIIAEPVDAAALWLRPRLAARLASTVSIVTPMQLVCSRRILHRLSTGGASSRFVLANGQTIEGAALVGVVNRLGTLPTAHLASAPPRERIYARDELYAFILGWLSSLECPAINRPEPNFLGGPWYPPLEALQLAMLAGLPCALQRLSVNTVEPAPVSGEVRRSCFIVDQRVVGPLMPQQLRDALLRFAALWGGRLLQVDFAVADEKLVFSAATSFADFRSGGDILVRAIARALRP
ncbi:MAG: hypothetical protein K0R41_946 [Geminicoccaceae bacterium]|jgi:hypothetical protein|nr:hypothetical protein [Geminicoccaceae bacterium]MCE3247121.1 hypothetical protein [Geminicoccaceae bacterium]MDF2765534.1 hypothetical protein [Rhodospirillales bacterium]